MQGIDVQVIIILTISYILAFLFNFGYTDFQKNDVFTTEILSISTLIVAIVGVIALFVVYSLDPPRCNVGCRGQLLHFEDLCNLIVCCYCYGVTVSVSYLALVTTQLRILLIFPPKSELSDYQKRYYSLMWGSCSIFSPCGVKSMALLIEFVMVFPSILLLEEPEFTLIPSPLFDIVLLYI